MITNSKIIDFIRNRYGCGVSSEFYTYIDMWKDWWKGYCKTFHHYTVYNGKGA